MPWLPCLVTHVHWLHPTWPHACYNNTSTSFAHVYTPKDFAFCHGLLDYCELGLPSHTWTLTWHLDCPVRPALRDPRPALPRI